MPDKIDMPYNVNMGVSAYLDGELGPEEAAQIEAQFDDDPKARAQFEAFSQQKERLCTLFDAVDTQPENLETARLERRLTAAIQRRSASGKMNPPSALGLMASRFAAICGFVALGWWGHATWLPKQSGLPEYVSEAMGAHAVFAEDKPRTFEFAGSTSDGAAHWLSGKIGISIDPPDLTEHGVTLIGAQLLGTKEGPFGQFIYENTGGGRYSLTLGRHPAHQPVLPLQLAQYPSRTVAYWSTREIDYAMIGGDDAALMKAMAQNLGAIH